MERMKKEKESGTLLGVGTAYLPVKEIKGEFYVRVSDFNICMDSMRKELKEENKKLRDYVDNLDSENDNQAIEIEELKKENKKLKSDLSECECSFGFESDECEYWKREIKKHKPCLIKDEYVFNLGDYDYMILTSTTPQLKIIKKKNKGASTFTIDGFTAVGKTFSSLTDEEDLYEDVK